jgi:hypothetical protein
VPATQPKDGNLDRTNVGTFLLAGIVERLSEMHRPYLSLAMMIAAWASLALGSACSTSPISSTRTYAVTFTEDSAQFYTLASSSCPAYCKAWQRSTRASSATLEFDGSSARMVSSQDGNWDFDVMPGLPASNDSLQYRLDGVHCGGFSLKVSLTADSLIGTYTEVFDCHDLSAAGRVTGHR